MIYIIATLVFVLLICIFFAYKSKNSKSIQTRDVKSREELISYFAKQETEHLSQANVVPLGYETINLAVKGLFYRTQEEQARAKKLFEGAKVYLQLEMDNSKDKYATRVYTSDLVFIGYIDSAYSKKVCTMLKKDYSIYCYISKVTSDAIPYIYMNLYYKEKVKSKVNLSTLSNDEVSVKKKRLRENIKRTQKSIDKLASENKFNLMDNALTRLDEYKEELKRYDDFK